MELDNAETSISRKSMFPVSQVFLTVLFVCAHMKVEAFWSVENAMGGYTHGIQGVRK